MCTNTIILLYNKTRRYTLSEVNELSPKSRRHFNGLNNKSLDRKLARTERMHSRHPSHRLLIVDIQFKLPERLSVSKTVNNERNPDTSISQKENSIPY